MKTVELYGDALLARLEKKYRIALTVMCALAVLTVAGWLFFLLTVNTANEKRNETAAIAVNAVGGCATLAVWVNAVLPIRRLIGHVRRMNAGEREALPFDDLPRISGNCAHVPHSIEVYRVACRCGGEAVGLLLERGRRKALGELPASGVFYTVDRYVVAWQSGGDGQ